MATKPKKGFTAKSQEKREVTNSQAANREKAANRENERIKAIAARPMLSDPESRIQDTDYWACKPK